MALFDETQTPEKLDAYDEKILACLEKDARISFRQLGKKVRLAPDTTAYRVKKMVDSGVIDRFTTHFNKRSADYDQYYILFQLSDASPENVADFIKTWTKKRECTRITSYTDKWDYLITLQCKSIEELDQILNSINSKFAPIMHDQEIMEKVRDYYHPIKPFPDLTQTDRLLINKLIEYSRATTVELGLALGISADSVSYHLKRLPVTFHTVPNYNKIGKHYYTVIAMMTVFGKPEEAKLKSYLQMHPQFIGAVKTIGEWNLILELVVPDSSSFHASIKNFRTVFASSIKDIDTLQGYQELKNKPFI